MGNVDVLLGMQWGDEGKGKIVDCLAPSYDLVARFQGGPNAGHTLKFDDKEIVLHTIPSGVFHDKPMNLIGNGVVLDPVTFAREVKEVSGFDVDLNKKLLISDKTHLILPSHRILDAAAEDAKGNKKIGSTLKGIGPTYMDKTGRNGLRIGDIFKKDFRERYTALVEKHKRLLKLYTYEEDLSALEEEWFKSLDLLRSMKVVDSHYYINEKIDQGWKVLAEGAQGSLLDIDFGTYPYVTSSNTISASACIGLGIAPQTIGEVFGIAKAYTTRVGGGPFPTELKDETGEKLQKKGGEFGATTGRARRCGWLDLPVLKYSSMINGVSQIFLTKIDVLDSFEEIKVCTDYKASGQISQKLPFDLNGTDALPQYKNMPGWNVACDKTSEFEDLPGKMINYIDFVADYLKKPVTLISNGPRRDQLIRKNVQGAEA